MLRLRFLILILLFAASMLAAGQGVQASQSTTATSFVHPGSALPYVASARAQPTPPAVNYDEQIGMTFTQSFTGTSYNVTAVQQTDSNGYGPAYLLNGVTDGGYWYQIGITYNWPGSVGYYPGWAVVYEVWDAAQNSVFPANGGGGLANLTGPVRNGDSVLLSLSFSGSQVQMTVKDWNTGATGSEPYAAFGSRFVGLTAPSDSNGYFTGPMTEWYHAAPYYATDEAVVYENHLTALAGAYVWADEFNANTSAPLFGSDKLFTFTSPNQLQSFSTNGAVVHADAYTFITGGLTQITLTFGYSVAGGGGGYSAPTLTYISNGTARTATLSGSLVTYYSDVGASWSVSATLPGSTSTERWAASQPSGVADSPVTENVTYYHQFLASFVYRISGGGAGYSAPSVQSSIFGGSTSVEGNASGWADAGAPFTYPTVLPGSSASERWAAQNGGGTVMGSSPVSVRYFLQYGVTLAYSIVGGGTPGAPSLSGIQFGEVFTSTVTNSTTYFVDPGSAWSISTQLLNGNSHERWSTTQGSGGTASAPTSLLVSYSHQYSLTIASSPAAGGNTTQTSGWVDAGSSVQISQVANRGWEFEGWTGGGSGAYTGLSNSTTIVVEAPMNETATYYPGLTIRAGAYGTVTYAYGAASGVVQPGSSRTVYAEPGTTFTLKAAPSSFLYSFSGWVGASGSDASTTVTLLSPESIDGNFSVNSIIVGGIAAAVIVAVVALTAAIRLRGRTPTQN